MTRQELTLIGTCVATHGIKGEVQCTIQNDIFEQIEIEYFIVEIDGTFIPFFIDEYRWKSNATLLVKFIDVDAQQDALQLVHHQVFIPTALCPEGTDSDLTSDQLIGMKIIDRTHGEIGTIVNVDFITQENSILLLDNDLIIPLHPDLVISLDVEKATLIMNLPDGLIGNQQETIF